MSTLSQKEKFEAYIIPFYSFVTGTRWGFRKRVKQEFRKKVNEYNTYGQNEKALLFQGLEDKAIKIFRWFTYLLVLVGLLIVIFVD